MKLSYSVYVKETGTAYVCSATEKDGILSMPYLGTHVKIVVDDVEHEGIVIQHSLDTSEDCSLLPKSMTD